MSMDGPANRSNEWNEAQDSRNNRPGRESQFPAPAAAPDGRRLPRFAARPMECSPHCGRRRRRPQSDKPKRAGAPDLPRPPPFLQRTSSFSTNLSAQFFSTSGSRRTRNGIDQRPLQCANKDTSVVGSIASTGFGLTAICIAEKRGFVSYQEARLRVLATLVYLVEEAANASRILLSLRQHQYRRKNMGLRSLLGRHHNAALRDPYLPAALSG